MLPIAETATPAYLCRKALAQHASVSLRTVDNWLADPVRQLPRYNWGTHVVIHRDEFDAWARQHHRSTGGSLEEKIRKSKPLNDARKRLRRERRTR